MAANGVTRQRPVTKGTDEGGITQGIGYIEVSPEVLSVDREILQQNKCSLRFSRNSGGKMKH